MAQLKDKTMFVCSECGFDSPKWSGKEVYEYGALTGVDAALKRVHGGDGAHIDCALARHRLLKCLLVISELWLYPELYFLYHMYVCAVCTESSMKTGFPDANIIQTTDTTTWNQSYSVFRLL